MTAMAPRLPAEGDMFRCERLRCTLARSACVRRWQEARPESTCHRCPVGRENAEQVQAPRLRPEPGSDLQRRRSELAFELLAALGCATPGQVLHLANGREGLTRTALVCRALGLLVEAKRVEHIHRGVYRVAGLGATWPRPEPNDRGLSVHAARRRALLAWLSSSPRGPITTAEASAHLLEVAAPCSEGHSARLEETRVALRVLRNQGHLHQVGQSTWRLKGEQA